MPSPQPTPPKADHPVLPVITERWSPYAFEPRPVEREKLLSCLEAARWAPSSYNEQPWTFVLVTDVERKRAIRAAVEKEEKADQNTYPTFTEGNQSTNCPCARSAATTFSRGAHSTGSAVPSGTHGPPATRVSPVS